MRQRGSKSLLLLQRIRLSPINMISQWHPTQTPACACWAPGGVFLFTPSTFLLDHLLHLHSSHLSRSAPPPPHQHQHARGGLLLAFVDGLLLAAPLPLVLLRRATPSLCCLFPRHHLLPLLIAAAPLLPGPRLPAPAHPLRLSARPHGRRPTWAPGDLCLSPLQSAPAGSHQRRWCPYMLRTCDAPNSATPRTAGPQQGLNESATTRLQRHDPAGMESMGGGAPGSKSPPTGGVSASAAGSSASQRRRILEPPLPLVVHTTKLAAPTPTSGNW